MKPAMLLTALLAFPAMANASPEAVVRDFLAAFNQQNIPQMLSNTHQAVYWNHIKGQKVDTKAETQAEFGAALQDYFESLPGAHAEILSMTASGSYVSILEQVSWTVDGEINSQCSLGVYELIGEKISSIWYYPAHVCEPRDNQMEQSTEALAPEASATH
ncbi:nuclear transport factor 2 family protein [Shewanella khirikhana]|uniref:SnoaL-like domain protein n=1 Tax=Shewanella khirikhana TaxID=1965282 RepID=A0ABM8HJN1_9GAMM|nr:nuclear transport factor 2 family protein [Shewanella khirikhana]AZQ13062.1 SnoaL-like domain protein [Shewanella khirikhana]